MILTLAALMLGSRQLPAQDADRHWTAGTAWTLPAGRWEDGLFAHYRRGLTDKLELQLNPLLGQLMPHVNIKVRRNDWRGWERSYRYGILSPTPLMRLFRREGTGGIFPVDPDLGAIPWMVRLRQEALLSRLGVSGITTLKAGISIAMGGGKLDSRYQLELPVLYPRLALFHQGIQFNFSAGQSQYFSDKFSLWTDLGLILTPGYVDPFAWEHKSLVYWLPGSRLRFAAGYKLVYGKYPMGTLWHLLPLFDIQLGSR